MNQPLDTSRGVAILGAGTMGAGIAATCLVAGLPVRLIDNDPEALRRASGRIAAFLERQVANGRLAPERAAALPAALSTSADLSAAAPAAVVIEAVFEDLAVKRELMRRVEPLVSPDCVIATNTSCLRVGDIASVLARPERFLGLHYFSPAEVNPVVELVAAKATGAGALAAAREFLLATGKEPLPCRDSNGFALNRFFCPYCNEAVRCLEEGLARPGQIDAVACRTFELPLGPFAVMNIIHPRILLNAEQGLAALGDFYLPAALLRDTGEAGELWPIEPDSAPLPEARARLVAERLMGAVLLAGGEVVAEGVVEADELDRGARRALRFGKPPGALARALGPAETARLVAMARHREAPALDGGTRHAR